MDLTKQPEVPSKLVDVATATNLIAQAVPVHLQESERLTPLMGAYDSIYAQSFKYAQYNPDLLTAQKGFDEFDKMLTLAACHTPFEVKRNAVLSKDWEVKPCINDPNHPDFKIAEEYAEFCAYCLRNIVNPDSDNVQSFRSVIYEMLRACWDGFHVTEIEWRYLSGGPYKGKWGFRYFASKPAKQIGFDLDLYTLATANIMPYTPLTGYEPPKPLEKVLLYTYRPQHGLPYGMGDARACYKHYWILDSLMKFWSIAAERFGGPVLVVKYPAGDTVALKNAQIAVNSIRQGSAAILPDNVQYELVNIDAKTLEAFKVKADWHLSQISQNILGNTLTTREGERSGSLALGQVHNQTQDYGLNFIRKDVEEVITNQLFRRLIRYNFGEDQLDLTPLFTLGDYKDLNIAVLTQLFTMLIQTGNMPARSPEVRKACGLPPESPEEAQLFEQQYALQKQGLIPGMPNNSVDSAK
jgi:hypothetical protein